MCVFVVEWYFNFVKIGVVVVQFFGCIDNCLFVIEFVVVVWWMYNWFDNVQ